jgi:hypothetical protein
LNPSEEVFVPELKLMTFNVEWMISLLVQDKARLLASFPGKSLGPIRLAPIADVPALARRIAGVIEAVDPDVLAVREGPPLESRVDRFVADFLDDASTTFSSN